jgi:gluconate 2-dehydrogenase
VGYDHFDLSAMRRHRVLGTHTPGVLDDTVADLAMALMLATARRIVELDGWVRGGRWANASGEELFGVDVHHRTLGIIGMGRIGAAVAKRAHFGFDMRVLYHSRTRHVTLEQSVPATYAALADLLAEADFVVLLTPLTPQTIGLMNAARFAQMKASAIFINLSRGKTVDEAALYEALATGQIRGAGLDVFATEPTPVDNPLLTLPNVVVVPHIGSATQVTRDGMEALAVSNLLAVLAERFDKASIVPELQDLVPPGSAV